MTPGPVQIEISNALDASFTKRQIAELSIGIALFHGFSKMLIGLGREPEEMDTTVVPTPHLPLDPKVTNVHSHKDFSHLFIYIPEVESRWNILEQGLLSMDALPEEVLQLAKRRMSEVLGVTHLTSPTENPYSEHDEFFKTISENFVFHIRSISSATRAKITEMYGSEGLLQFMFGMALYDGIFRMEATKITSPDPNM